MFRDNLENNNADIEKAKKDYKFWTTVNTVTFDGVKVVVDPKYAFKAGIDIVKHNVQSSFVDAELFKKNCSRCRCYRKRSHYKQKVDPGKCFSIHK